MPITRALQGKTVHQVMTDEKRLLIRCTDGTEAVIEWSCDGPVLAQQNVRILLDLPGMGATPGNL